MTLLEAVNYLLDDFSLGDKIYDVRSRAVESYPVFVGDSWEHPKVLKFSEAVTALDEYRKAKR